MASPKSKCLTVVLGVILLGVGIGLGRWSQSWPVIESQASDEAQTQGEHPVSEADEPVIHLSDAHQKEFGITMTPCGSGLLEIRQAFPGEIELNSDHEVRLCARVGGVVRQVTKGLGDAVRAGDILAVIQSPELAEMRARYLSASERLTLAETLYVREKDLYAQTITSQQDYEAAAAALAEARITLRAVEQALLALSLTADSLSQLPNLSPEAFSDYAVTAPFSGTIIDRKIVKGQSVEATAEVFTVADMSRVWIDVSVPAEAGASVHPGQLIVVTDTPGQVTAEAKIRYVAPIIDEATRTILARADLPNEAGQWRPGQFVTVQVVTARVEASLVVPKTALQPVDDRFCVFVHTDQGFVPCFVTCGRSNETSVEILTGLEPGQSVVTTGAFTLKAEWLKNTFGGDDD